MKNYLHKVIIGQLLADCYVERTSKNCRLSFSFGAKYKLYADWIYELFKDYCSKSVYVVNSKANKKEYSNYRLKTRTLSEFNQYRDMFYKLIDEKFVKIIPSNIQDIMCPIVLAHLIMGDGSFSKVDNRIRIFTNSFTFQECCLLADSITKNCDIECRVLFDRVGKKNEKQYILTIGKKQLTKVQTVLAPHMHKSMIYKIGITLIPQKSLIFGFEDFP